MKRVAAFFLLFTAPAWAATKPLPPLHSQTVLLQQKQNKAVARHVFDEIFNQGKFQVADEIYAKDFVNHEMHRDFSPAKDQAAQRFEKQACPDLKMAIGPMIAEIGLVSVLWIARGTNTARVGWMPATGAKIEVRGITIWRIVDGKIREEWSSFIEMTILREVAYQLGWQLIGLVCAALVLFWIAYQLIGRLLSRCFSPELVRQRRG
ncbi:MAG TPA: ester cyclase [Terracidiphilus sp.]|nr:ester cyclase [Terracidiphilus sp.]